MSLPCGRLLNFASQYFCFSLRPASISAALAFEQSYGQVDGDSAAVAELSALISAISQIPIDQSWAITGSMNQLGQVQPIGGVNAKI